MTLSLKNQDLTIKNRETHQTFTLRAKQKVLSYATRGMEPLRGFPEFMRALPPLLANNPSLQVVIAGADRRAYSYDAPSHNGSWREHLLSELGNFEGIERIMFTGLLTYADYRLLLWRTDLHCYFTRPYVNQLEPIRVSRVWCSVSCKPIARHRRNCRRLKRYLAEPG